jgi:hypothetical protein
VAKGKKRSTPEKQTLILWALLGRDGAAAFQNELKPEPEKADRLALEEAGLVKSEPRQNRRIWIEVTERGWEWAGRNLGAQLPAGSPAGSQILRAWLIRLKTFMDAKGFVLADVLAPQSAAKPVNQLAQKPLAPAHNSTVRNRIREAYLEISGGRLNTRVLLRDLRGKLHDIEREEIDAALNQMQREQQASLYQLDNRAEITDADRSAAIYFGNEPRHILWIER